MRAGIQQKVLMFKNILTNEHQTVPNGLSVIDIKKRDNDE
jgi:hypothetical protein